MKCCAGKEEGLRHGMFPQAAMTHLLLFYTLKCPSVLGAPSGAVTCWTFRNQSVLLFMILRNSQSWNSKNHQLWRGTKAGVVHPHLVGSALSGGHRKPLCSEKKPIEKQKISFPPTVPSCTQFLPHGLGLNASAVSDSFYILSSLWTYEHWNIYLG